jgi:hypothetical protein
MRYYFYNLFIAISQGYIAVLILFISSYLPWWFGDVTKPTIILEYGIGWFGLQHHFWFFLCFRSIHLVQMADNPIKAYRFEPKRQIQNTVEQNSNDSDDSDDDNFGQCFD